MDLKFYTEATQMITTLRNNGEEGLANWYNKELMNCKSEDAFWRIHGGLNDELFVLGV
tara:strand:+ start:1479 stop:1652 length:174 start_codon:yes stop_codon:yes gene_type:complete